MPELREEQPETGSNPEPAPALRRVGLVLISIEILATLAEWLSLPGLYLAAGLGIVGLLALVTPRVGWSRRVFIAAGLALFLAALATREDWFVLTEQALRSAAFVAGFFAALTWLYSAATTSPQIERCGRFLAEQPPGRRYLALTVGGHLFGLVVLFGAIPLLGSLAVSSARHEPNEELRNIRTRRMLLAIQRGLNATACWSPLTFSIAVTTSVIPGASWGAMMWPGLVGGLLFLALGWALDTVVKPKLSGPRPPPARPKPGWGKLKPLLLLLAVMMTSVGLLHLLSGKRVAAIVMLVVPLISLCWIAIQGSAGARVGHTTRQTRDFVFRLLPDFQSELVLIVMAGFIGTLGARLLVPLAANAGLDLTGFPPWGLLLAMLWLVPITGQLGMNPILSVSLFAPLLPNAEALSLSPSAIVLAITAGWALSGVSSPYSATTLIVGAIGNASSYQVGLRWNGLFTVLGGCILSIWVLIVWGLQV